MLWTKTKPAPESWAGGCQGICAGKFSPKDNDDLLLCSGREALEELGDGFASWHHDYFLDRSLKNLPLFESNPDQVPGSGTAFITMRGRVSVVKLIRFHNPTGGLEFVTFEQLDTIQNLKEICPNKEAVPEGIIAMMPDELEALRRLWPKS